MSAICDAHKKKVDAELLYNSVHRNFNELEKDAVQKTSTQRGWGPGPRLSSPGERGKNAVVARGVGVNMLQFWSVSNSLSHSETFGNPFELFQIKWEVYFSKELCRSSLLCRCYDSGCICACIVGHGYTTHIY